MTAAGTLTFETMRSKNPHFLGQAWHLTENRRWNDTLNFLLQEEDGGHSTGVVSFSISQIAGAYGDMGQNFFNLKQLFDSIQWESAYELTNLDASCPPPVIDTAANSATVMKTDR